MPIIDLNNNLPQITPITAGGSQAGTYSASTLPINPIQSNSSVVLNSNNNLPKELNLLTENGTEDISKQLDEKLTNQFQTLNNLQTQISTTSFSNLGEILNYAIKRDASDVHITVDYPPTLRVDGDLLFIVEKKLLAEEVFNFVKEIVASRNDINLEIIKQVDLGYNFAGRRFRVNIFKEMGNFSIVMRLIPQIIKTIDELNLPKIFHEFTKVPAGLILVTGPTGSGKSTTLASILNEINITQKKHILTIEDPIEFVYPTGQSVIEQRELGMDFDSFPSALKALLRQDPNVVLVGEMRDYETISSAVTVSETGHLVFATLHTNSASQSIDRIIDVFPEAQQSQIRSQLANVLTAVISQRLVKLINGKRKAVHEILIASPAVRNAIREDKTYQIDNMIQTGQDLGMVSMEKSLVELVFAGMITKESALKTSVKPKELEILLNK